MPLSIRSVIKFIHFIHSFIYSSVCVAILISNLTCTRTLTFFSADVKRRRSLYDEDSLDGDRPYENEGTNVFKGIVQTIFLSFSLDSSSYFDDANESSVFNTVNIYNNFNNFNK